MFIAPNPQFESFTDKSSNTNKDRSLYLLQGKKYGAELG